MGYLDMIQRDERDENHGETCRSESIAQNNQTRERSEISEQNPICSRCGQSLSELPETRALAVCCRCLTEREWVDVLARMKQRRQRTRHAVTARMAQLGYGGAS